MQKPLAILLVGLLFFPAAFAESQRFKSQELIDSIEAADRVRSAAWYGELQRKDRGLAEGWHRADLDEAACADNPEDANLYNRAGLPVAPFAVRR